MPYSIHDLHIYSHKLMSLFDSMEMIYRRFLSCQIYCTTPYT